MPDGQTPAERDAMTRHAIALIASSNLESTYPGASRAVYRLAGKVMVRRQLIEVRSRAR